MFDAIVVGAGPAGSSAAYRLAQKGCSVLVIEKAPLPRTKPCSGALSPLVSQWFDFEFAPVIDQQVRQIRYTWKLADDVVGELQTHEPIWIVKREQLDTFLIDQAIAQGAQVQDQTPVTGIEFVNDHWVVRTPNDTVEGRYLIAADGANGRLADWLGLEFPPLRQGAILTAVLDHNPENTALNFEFG